MTSENQAAAFTFTAIDAEGRRFPVPAVALEIDLGDGSGQVRLEASQPEGFAGQIVLHAEPVAALRDSHFCTFVVRPGACNVLHVGLETQPGVELE